MSGALGVATVLFLKATVTAGAGLFVRNTRWERALLVFAVLLACAGVWFAAIGWAGGVL